MKTRKFFEKILSNVCKDEDGKNKDIKGGIVVLVNKDMEVYHVSDFGKKIDDVYLENAILASGILLEVSKDQLVGNFKFLKKKLGETEFKEYIKFLLSSESSIKGIIEEAIYEMDHTEESMFEDVSENEEDFDDEESVVS